MTALHTIPPPHAKGLNGKFSCPCCGAFTLKERSIFSICPVCFWEDDGTVDENEGWGPNRTSLAKARANFKEFGSCDKDMLKFCRKERPEELEAQ